MCCVLSIKKATQFIQKKIFFDGLVNGKLILILMKLIFFLNFFLKMPKLFGERVFRKV